MKPLNNQRLRTCSLLLLLVLLAPDQACIHAQSTRPGQDAPAAESSSLSQYVGQYRWNSDPDVTMSVYLDAGRLYQQREGRAPEVLVEDSRSDAAGLDRDRFALPRVASHLVFVRDAGGAITGCRLLADRDGRTLVTETRVSGEPLPATRFRRYTREELTIPMRDGVRLHAVLLRPAQTAAEPLPVLLERTPYGVDENDSEGLNLNKPELASSGYLFVYEDIRGRYRSEGQFIMTRPIVPHVAKTDVDETTDAYDTIDWLVRNVPGNNGRVGVTGVSYVGYLATMAAIEPHPAVKAISPQAPMTDVWLGDDFFHNGAFRQSYGFDYVQEMEAQKTDVFADLHEDAFDFFLKHVNFAGAASAAKIADLPTARAFLTQPEYTAFWRDKAVEPHLSRVTVPTLEVGGFWDQEDMWGTQAQYAALKPHDPDHQLFLVLGPWNHGGWEDSGRTLGSTFGTLNFGEPTGIEFRKQFEFPFFERYLKDRPGFDLADTATFRTGTNQWERYSSWPPASGFEPRKLYLQPGQALTFTPPAASPAQPVAASYVADPANPIPYRHRPIQSTYARNSKWFTWMVEDQRFLAGRNDLATFETPVLDHDLTLTGEIMADLFASTSGSDADWIVKLIDVYPDAPRTAAADSAGSATPGYELMVAGEIFRGRYLHSFVHPEALKPAAVNEFKWSLHGVDHTFLKGHRILVQVQSSWFPLYDRNPQTFVPNIMTAPAAAYRPQTMTIYASPEWPSHLDIYVTAR